MAALITVVVTLIIFGLTGWATFTAWKVQGWLGAQLAEIYEDLPPGKVWGVRIRIPGTDQI